MEQYQWPTWEELKRTRPDRAREIAFHEAGHASMHLVFGTVSDLMFIDMRGTATRSAFVRSRGLSPTDEISMLKSMPKAARRAATRAIMHNLSGPCAEGRISGDADWLETLQAEQDGEDEGEEEGDWEKAIGVADLIYPGKPGRAWAYFRHVARWTDEAMDDPRLWRAVEAIAERLLNIPDILDGDEAICLARAASGLSLGPPWKHGKWRRRLTLRKGDLANVTVIPGDALLPGLLKRGAS